MYYALQYLSLSDAVVLTFLIPVGAAISGYFLLGEGYTRGQAVAAFISLIGVVLIARPEFLFGSLHPTLQPSIADGIDGTLDSPGIPAVIPSERGTPAQRLGAVGVAMLGVLGGTGAVTSLTPS